MIQMIQPMLDAEISAIGMDLNRLVTELSKARNTINRPRLRAVVRNDRE